MNDHTHVLHRQWHSIALLVTLSAPLTGCSDRQSAAITSGTVPFARTTGSSAASPSAVGLRRQASAPTATLIAAPGADAQAASKARGPQVLMSAHHEATCLARVGDLFPRLELTALDGQTTNLADYLGRRLTVVVFWSRLHASAVEQVSRLDKEVTSRYADAGVQTVAVNVNDAVQDVRQLQTAISHEFVGLLDRDGRAFQQVASDILPRTYLLDANGRIVWFDIEYSRSSRRDLDLTIQAHINPEQPGTMAAASERLR